MFKYREIYFCRLFWEKRLSKPSQYMGTMPPCNCLGVQDKFCFYLREWNTNTHSSNKKKEWTDFCRYIGIWFDTLSTLKSLCKAVFTKKSITKTCWWTIPFQVYITDPIWMHMINCTICPSYQDTDRVDKLFTMAPNHDNLAIQSCFCHQNIVDGTTTYRVIFLTGPTQKSSKYGTGPT